MLAGTNPLNIDIRQSDLDIICCFTDKEEFENDLSKNFGTMTDFVIRRVEMRGDASVVATFKLEKFEVKIFGQAIQVTEQLAHKHMLIDTDCYRSAESCFDRKSCSRKKTV